MTQSQPYAKNISAEKYKIILSSLTTLRFDRLNFCFIKPNKGPTSDLVYLENTVENIARTPIKCGIY